MIAIAPVVHEVEVDIAKGRMCVRTTAGDRRMRQCAVATCHCEFFCTFKDRATIAIAVASFANADFPAPTLERHVPLRHPGVPLVDPAEQFESFRPT